MIHVTPAATANLTDIYATISKAYARNTASGGSDDLAKELDGVKKTLHDTRRATTTDFVCLRVPPGQGAAKAKTSGSAGGGGGTTLRSASGGDDGSVPPTLKGVGAPGEGIRRG